MKRDLGLIVRDVVERVEVAVCSTHTAGLGVCHRVDRKARRGLGCHVEQACLWRREVVGVAW